MSTHKFSNLRKSTLFEHARLKSEALNAPLATRMRPRVFDEYIGQKHLLDQNRLLKRAIEEDQVPSMILWGPPGVGKTTLARIIASATKMHFISASAVTSGVSELREAIAAKLSKVNGIPTASENVLVTNGGKQAIYNLFQVLLNAGDEVLIPSPYWLSYPEIAILAGATPIKLPSSP